MTLGWNQSLVPEARTEANEDTVRGVSLKDLLPEIRVMSTRPTYECFCYEVAPT